MLLSRTQAAPSSTVKQQQEQISPNHVQAFFPSSVDIKKFRERWQQQGCSRNLDNVFSYFPAFLYFLILFSGNFLAIPILCSRRMSSVFNRLLVCLAVSDNLFILCCLLGRTTHCVLLSGRRRGQTQLSSAGDAY